jgi:hypothetical protein
MRAPDGTPWRTIIFFEHFGDGDAFEKIAKRHGLTECFVRITCRKVEAEICRAATLVNRADLPFLKRRSERALRYPPLGEIPP